MQKKRVEIWDGNKSRREFKQKKSQNTEHCSYKPHHHNRTCTATVEENWQFFVNNTYENSLKVKKSTGPVSSPGNETAEAWSGLLLDGSFVEWINSFDFQDHERLLRLTLRQRHGAENSFWRLAEFSARLHLTRERCQPTTTPWNEMYKVNLKSCKGNIIVKNPRSAPNLE